jgi:hypothetical protein
MQKALIDTASGEVLNTIELPDDWTGVEGEWQAPSGHSVIDMLDSGLGDTWNGTVFVKSPAPVITTDQAFAELREERNSLLHDTDWWVLRGSITEAQTSYRQQLRDLPANTADPADPVWPTAP